MNQQQTCPKCGQPLTHEADGERHCVKCVPIVDRIITKLQMQVARQIERASCPKN